MSLHDRPYALNAPVADPASVDAAILSRGSVRGFLPTPVPRATIEHLLMLAGQAPSGTNTQPWRVYVASGEQRERIEREVCAAHDAARAAAASGAAAMVTEEYDYYPTQWFDPYLARRRENGWGLYGTLGIGKADKDAMHAQHQANFRFFGAPVGLFFTVDRRLGRGSLVDMGMFLQTLMIAARAHGLDTCPQAAWNTFGGLVRQLIGAGEHEMLVCGMSLGHVDAEARANRFRATREPVESFTRWL
ncbi:MAG: nitroreductase [Rubrivivax sp.]|nr:nitroreductase [Rubrivivax sp.]